MRLTVFLSVFLLLFSCSQSRAGGTIRIVMEPIFNGKPVLPDQLYVTANGDSVYIDLFRFYISAVSMNGDSLLVPETNSYHLVDIENKQSLAIDWKDVPAHTYHQLEFNVGIDSATNMSGAMGGDLDPAKAMYWAWNTGYINAKLEGRSKVCKTLHHVFEFHVGGFMPPYQTLRKISLPLDNITVTDGAMITIRIQADVATWFTGIQLATTNSIVTPGTAAAQMASNYMHMFRVIQNPGQ